jgi:hypothetical protein
MQNFELRLNLFPSSFLQMAVVTTFAAGLPFLLNAHNRG